MNPVIGFQNIGHPACNFILLFRQRTPQFQVERCLVSPVLFLLPTALLALDAVFPGFGNGPDQFQPTRGNLTVSRAWFAAETRRRDLDAHIPAGFYKPFRDIAGARHLDDVFDERLSRSRIDEILLELFRRRQNPVHIALRGFQGGFERQFECGMNAESIHDRHGNKSHSPALAIARHHQCHPGKNRYHHDSMAKRNIESRLINSGDKSLQTIGNLTLNPAHGSGSEPS